MNKETFKNVVDRIQNHPIFKSRSFNKQVPVEVQLLLALQRFGCDGNGASLGNNARFGGIGEGTVILYTNRVIVALLALRDEIIYWPDETERIKLARQFGEVYGIPGAVGIVDGTPVIFSQRPHIDGEVYWSRKCIYCLNVQLICDINKLIRYYILGWPGSVFDNTVFEKSRLAQVPGEYFSPGQFLLADSGYALSEYVCVPYRQPAASVPHNKLYNELFSSARVLIEHVNGILKGRFSSLRGLRTQVRQKKDIDSINKWILSCLILHNICVIQRDDWVEEYQEDEEEINNIDNIDHNNNAGMNLRLQVQNKLLQWYHRYNNN
jgi:hypothetical protein